MRICKYILLIIIIILLLSPVPKYVELNHLKIINKIKIECINSTYNVTLYEIIPKKINNSINYDYKRYNLNDDNIEELKYNFDSKYSFYYGSLKVIKIYNCKELDDIKKTFLISRNVKIIMK